MKICEGNEIRWWGALNYHSAVLERIMERGWQWLPWQFPTMTRPEDEGTEREALLAFDHLVQELDWAARQEPLAMWVERVGLLGAPYAIQFRAWVHCGGGRP